MEFRVVIPARFASTRFPGKALAPIAGKPMVQRVWEQARASGAAEILVATDDERIRACAESFGASVVMTSAAHRSGTERTAEVAVQRRWPDDAVVINVQGDAPLVPPESIRRVARLLHEHPGAAVASLCTPLRSAAEFHSPHVVKVVTDSAGRALYFSRAAIPSPGHGSRTALPGIARRHIGLYGYRVAGLRVLAAAPACALEEIEQLEQLRALWLGLELRMTEAEEPHGPDVDTPDDVAAAEAWLAARGSA